MKITRIVTMQIYKSKIDDFRLFLTEERIMIQEFQGCVKLQLFEDAHMEGRFVSVSEWESAYALEIYRTSDFFRANWARIKPWFAAAPKAMTLNEL